MPLKIEFEYLETPDEAKRIRNIARILAQGVYTYLKNEGLLRVDPGRKEKVQKAISRAREITHRQVDSA